MSTWRTQLIDVAVQARCLRQQLYTQRRCLSQTSAPKSLPSTGAARLSNRRLIFLNGPDTSKFLQGILTNNVNEFAPQSGFFAAFLNAQGKILHDVFVYPTLGTAWHKEQSGDGDAGYLVEVDADSSDLLLKHIKRHKLRSKFKLRLLDQGELNVWSAWKDERWTQHTKAKSGCDLGLTDCRAPGMGCRLLLQDEDHISDIAELEITEEVPLSTYTLRRYLRGIPEGQHEIPREESLPMNYNLDIMGGIDFKKGCYIGQELTIRTHHTGVVRRRVLPVQLHPDGADQPEQLAYDPESDVPTIPPNDIKKDDARKRSVGKLIANVGDIGIAMCRLEQMSDLPVSSEGSSQVQDDRFIVEIGDGRTIGLKAFVPDWIRNRIRDPKVQRRIE